MLTLQEVLAWWENGNHPNPLLYPTVDPQELNGFLHSLNSSVWKRIPHEGMEWIGAHMLKAPEHFDKQVVHRAWKVAAKKAPSRVVPSSLTKAYLQLLFHPSRPPDDVQFDAEEMDLFTALGYHMFQSGNTTIKNILPFVQEQVTQYDQAHGLSLSSSVFWSLWGRWSEINKINFVRKFATHEAVPSQPLALAHALVSLYEKIATNQSSTLEDWKPFVSKDHSLLLVFQDSLLQALCLNPDRLPEHVRHLQELWPDVLSKLALVERFAVHGVPTWTILPEPQRQEVVDLLSRAPDERKEKAMGAVQNQLMFMRSEYWDDYVLFCEATHDWPRKHLQPQDVNALLSVNDEALVKTRHLSQEETVERLYPHLCPSFQLGVYIKCQVHNIPAKIHPPQVDYALFSIPQPFHATDGGELHRQYQSVLEKLELSTHISVPNDGSSTSALSKRKI